MDPQVTETAISEACAWSFACLVVAAIVIFRWADGSSELGSKAQNKPTVGLDAAAKSTEQLQEPPQEASVPRFTFSIEEPMDQGWLTLAVVSDTHGFERGLRVPDADVLVHCGDFTADRHPRTSEKLFDQWLGEQSHPVKLVVRGNHDSRKFRFSSKGVVYAVNPRLVTIAGVRFSLLPWTRKGGAQSAVEWGDVIVSHCPPYGCLDMNYDGLSIGDKRARKLVEQLTASPLLWLCGHVHEDRGTERMERRKRRRRKKDLWDEARHDEPRPPVSVDAVEWQPDQVDQTAHEKRSDGSSEFDEPGTSTSPRDMDAGSGSGPVRGSCSFADETDIGIEFSEEETAAPRLCDGLMEDKASGRSLEIRSEDYIRVFNASNANDGRAVGLEPSRLPIIIRLRLLEPANTNIRTRRTQDADEIKINNL